MGAGNDAFSTLSSSWHGFLGSGRAFYRSVRGEALPDAADREGSLRRIRELLAEAHRVDTRAHDLEAARQIDRILKAGGLDLHSPALLGRGSTRRKSAPCV